MPTDYRDAAERHWEDAGCLLADNRAANADHLFGLSAECALKAMMMGLGMPLRPDGAPKESRHRVHINDLWDEFVSFASSRGGARCTTYVDGISNPFDDWNVAQRYAHRADIPRAAVDRHKSGTEKTKAAMDAAIVDGVVT